VGRFLTVTYVWARRCAIAMIGGTVVVIGVLMIVLPGPAFVVIPAGLAILGLEFACARRWLCQLRTAGTQVFSTTLSRFFNKRSTKRTTTWMERETFRRSHRRLYAVPPFAREQLAVGRPRRVKASTKTGYY
jgi:Putative transmembrane protein (PGPGW)